MGGRIDWGGVMGMRVWARQRGRLRVGTKQESLQCKTCVYEKMHEFFILFVYIYVVVSQKKKYPHPNPCHGLGTLLSKKSMVALA